MLSTTSKLVSTLNIEQEQIDLVCALLDSKTPVPFIAKFQSHLTKGLKDYQIRQIQQAYENETELSLRRKTILESLQAHNLLNEQLESQVNRAHYKSTLADIYYPYRPERRNLAHFAKAGICGDYLNHLATSYASTDEFIASFEATDLNQEQLLADLKVLLGEACLTKPSVVHALRKHLWQQAKLKSSVIKGRESAVRLLRENVTLEKNFNQISFQEGLALFRGRSENINKISLNFKTDDTIIKLLKDGFDTIAPQEAWFDKQLGQAFQDHILPKLTIELLNQLKDDCENKALKTFSRQLQQLLLQSPAGSHVTMGIVNAFKAGVKVVIVDSSGEFIDAETIFPLYTNGNWHDAQISLAKLITKYQVSSIAIAQKNGAKDILRLVNELNETYQDLRLVKLIISDAGARNYAHSDKAIAAHSQLDEWQREAISVARRLQDPIAEFSSLPLASIDVGANQQAINSQKVERAFQVIMEDAVNRIGVDINHATQAHLSYICGLSNSDAEKIVQYRHKNGNICSWEALKADVELSEKAVNYCGGFIKINCSENPLDRTFIPPTYYELVGQMAASLNKPVAELLGDRQSLKTLDINQFTTDELPAATVLLVIRHLERPFKTTRTELQPVQFNTSIKSLADLKTGDILNGVVGNITAFGAFVNIGIEQDGLVHVSEMPNNPKGRAAVLVKTGDVVKVKVIDINLEKKRLNLSLKLGIPATTKKPAQAVVKKKKPRKEQSPVNSAMADALLKLKLTK